VSFQKAEADTAKTANADERDPIPQIGHLFHDGGL
jgi:hypothetical protein